MKADNDLKSEKLKTQKRLTSIHHSSRDPRSKKKKKRRSKKLKKAKERQKTSGLIVTDRYRDRRIETDKKYTKNNIDLSFFVRRSNKNGSRIFVFCFLSWSSEPR